MKMDRSSDFLVLMIISTLLIFTGCPKEDKNDFIRIGVLPDSCVLPLYLMDSCRPVPFMSARERDTALQAGELDGVMTDLVSVTSHIVHGYPLKAVSLSESSFMIVGNPGFSIDQKWSIGISEHTVVEYIVDRLTLDTEVEKLSIPKVPLRLQMLSNGKIPMACITDVMAWPLLQQGFKIIKKQSDAGIDSAVIAFTDTWLDNSSEKLATFILQWNKAVNTINTNPEKYRNDLNEIVGLPGDIGRTYPVPVYRNIIPPSHDDVTDVLSWYIEKYDDGQDLSYEDIVLFPEF